MNTKIVTYTGKAFDLLNPMPDMVCIEDIAHSLSQLCRYTGHVREFYSVAQHCVLMAENEELPGDPLAKLLHDAAEAYIGDITSPWKQLLFLFEFDASEKSERFPALPTGHIAVKKWEQKIQNVVGLALGVNLEHSAEVKESDYRIALAEVRDLMSPSGEWKKWAGSLEPVKQEIVPWSPETAERKFLWLYNHLIGERNSG